MFAARSMASLAARQSRCCTTTTTGRSTTAATAALLYPAAREFAAACYYHAYALPSKKPPSAPRNDDVPETSIAQPGSLPKVHETRPPPSSSSLLGGTAREDMDDGGSLRSTSTSSAAAAAAAADSTSTSSTTSHHQASQQTQQQTSPAPPPPPPSTTTTTTTTPPRVSEASAQKPRPRPRPKLRPRKAAMRLTPAAVEQLRAMLDQPEPKLIKVGVRNRGCSGLAYHLEYVDGAGAFDEAVEQDGVRVLIDSKALFSIIGSEMDWAEDKLSQRFVFRNPNIKEECGCGESFMV